LVKWRGYDECSLEPAVDMDRLKAIDQFHTEQPGELGSTILWELCLRGGELLSWLCRVRIGDEV
jgi:hypothetical protein